MFGKKNIKIPLYWVAAEGFWQSTWRAEGRILNMQYPLHSIAAGALEPVASPFSVASVGFGSGSCFCAARLSILMFSFLFFFGIKWNVCKWAVGDTWATVFYLIFFFALIFLRFSLHTWVQKYTLFPSLYFYFIQYIPLAVSYFLPLSRGYCICHLLLPCGVRCSIC